LTTDAHPGRLRLDALLADLAIPVHIVEHAPVFTVEDVDATPHGLTGLDTKSLFLTDAKNQLYLLTMRSDRRADLKALPALLGSKRLSFASAEKLSAALGVLPGSVTPLAMVNDTAHRVIFALDKALAESEHIACHPLVNTATLSMRTADLIRILDAIGVTPTIVDLG
jgi:Ala-tRNA(Pro) deacylase